MIITQEEFNKAWRRMHPGMDIEAELAYYWELYQTLYNTCSTDDHDALVMDCVSKLLLYVEDMAHLKLGDAFMKEYRIAADFVLGTIKEMNLTNSQSSDVQIDVYLGIKNAPESGMKAYMREAFFGDDFNKLCDAMRWIMVRNQPLATVLSDRTTCKMHLREELSFIETDFLNKDRLAELWLAFNWTDKQGKSIAEHMKHCFEEESSTDWTFDTHFDMEVTDVDVFRVKRVKKDGRVFLINPDDRYNFYFEVDNMPHPIPDDYREKRVLGMIICWGMRCCICSPYWWISEEDADMYDADDFVLDLKSAIALDEQIEDVQLSTGETFKRYSDVACKGSFTWMGQNIPELLAESGIEQTEENVRQVLQELADDVFGGIKIPDDLEYDEDDSAEYEDISDIEAYQLHLLDVLKTGKYSIMPYAELGSLEMVRELIPGFNRVRLRWDLRECFDKHPTINLQLDVEEDVLEYDALTDEWTFPAPGDEVVDELYQWLEDNIDTDYTDIRKATTEIITHEDETVNFMPLFEYYKIDGKLYYYFPEEDDNIPWTDEDRQRASELMSKAEHLEFEDALKMVLNGDYDLLPAIVQDTNVSE